MSQLGERTDGRMDEAPASDDARWISGQNIAAGGGVF